MHMRHERGFHDRARRAALECLHNELVTVEVRSAQGKKELFR
jgi:hypothetical protein